jgi:hypothetical protein
MTPGQPGSAFRDIDPLHTGILPSPGARPRRAPAQARARADTIEVDAVN